jgi:hydroxyethylthiazole kinase-like uncharacterized protein yjeF
MKLVSVPEMRAIEEEANANGLTYDMMMENAGHNLSKEILQLAYSPDEDEDIQVLGLVGPGNNGGDTLVALTHLAEKGWKARAYLVTRKLSGDDLIKKFEDADGEVYQAEKDQDFQQLASFIEAADVVLDGVLGTGFKLPLKPEMSKVLGTAKSIIESLEWPPQVIAVDCPSGVDSDSGEISKTCIRADATVTMAAIKRGLLKLPAYDMVGELRVVEIGPLDELKSWQAVRNEVADDALARNLLPGRPSGAHKGTFGTTLITAGSVNFVGAALLAGKAAYRIGAGLVTLAIPAPIQSSLAGHLPEATWILLPHATGVISAGASEVLLSNLDRVTGILLGPGFGVEDTTKEFLSNFLEGARSRPAHGHMGFIPSAPAAKEDLKIVGLPPLVVDADGLKLLAKLPKWTGLLPKLSILTPHPGEMSILTGLEIEKIQEDRLDIALKYAAEWGHVVVLKGAFTVVADPDGRTTTIPIATSALARGGTGDVLAGVIVGLRAQGMDAYDAARLGAWIHARAGQVAAETQGTSRTVLAGDVLDSLVDVIAEME